MLSWLPQINKAQIIYVYFICIIFFTKKKWFLSQRKREKENVSWFLIGEFFLAAIIFPSRKSIYFFFLIQSWKRDICMQAIHSPEKKSNYEILNSFVNDASLRVFYIFFSLPHAYLNTNHSIRLLLATVCTTTTTYR
jgi:hypothetical protein